MNKEVLSKENKKTQWVEALKQCLSEAQVSCAHEDLLQHSCDCWPISIKVRQQEKRDHFPDVVVYPNNAEDVSSVLKWANENKVDVTPWGAGSAVTGSPLPLNGGITLDMSRMNKIIALDDVSLMITAEAGVMGDKLEQTLNDRGYTLNHSPQSLDRSTVGGWVATRATGQFSSRYGGIEHMIVSLTAVLPTGEIVHSKHGVRSALGPDLKQVFIGSEGTLGVVTEVTLKIFHLAEHRIFETISFDNVPAGLTVMRRIMQSGLRPFLVRYYDIDEARHAMQDKDFSSNVMFLGFEGLKKVAEAEYEAAMDICRLEGGTTLGSDATEAWMKRRFDFSTIENILNEPSGVAETIEIAHFWGDIYETYRKMKEALQPYVDEVLGHFSHAYADGTSLYMILLSKVDSEKSAADAEETLRAIWATANRVALEAGAVTAHHHGVGLARLGVIKEELGTSMEIMNRLKGALDPQGILCPGKLGLDEVTAED